MTKYTRRPIPSGSNFLPAVIRLEGPENVREYTARKDSRERYKVDMIRDKLRTLKQEAGEIEAFIAFGLGFLLGKNPIKFYHNQTYVQCISELEQFNLAGRISQKYFRDVGGTRFTLDRDFDPLPLSCSSQDHIIGETTIKALETFHSKTEKHRCHAEQLRPEILTAELPTDLSLCHKMETKVADTKIVHFYIPGKIDELANDYSETCVSSRRENTIQKESCKETVKNDRTPSKNEDESQCKSNRKRKTRDKIPDGMIIDLSNNIYDTSRGGIKINIISTHNLVPEMKFVAVPRKQYSTWNRSPRKENDRQFYTDRALFGKWQQSEENSEVNKTQM
ncbi:hypothetical protein G5I_13332 [Acromyrmex echinatior]|uniref:Uncharacterized protein n=1 Tax=Acromyrmex echinatior TaxID=103372 RepID=F4X4R2_ACREC|nr:hypothetical protein G5I_13332 [Acromyrmex echinatior]